MAVRYPSRVERLCMWGAAHIVTERQKLALEASRGIHGWEPDRRDSYLKIYGEEVSPIYRFWNWY